MKRKLSAKSGERAASPPSIEKSALRSSTRDASGHALEHRTSSLKRNRSPYNTPRRSRPVIGRPTDFRHIGQGTIPRPNAQFRPLELSIYKSDRRLSPLLPLFTSNGQPRINTTESCNYASVDDQSLPWSTSADKILEILDTLPSCPRPARLIPLQDRIKSVLIERSELDQMLRDVEEKIVKRQSICSRPTSRQSTLRPFTARSEGIPP